jgi:hypothetical protein
MALGRSKRSASDARVPRQNASVFPSKHQAAGASTAPASKSRPLINDMTNLELSNGKCGHAAA